MTSLILRTATRYLFVPLMIFSIYILLRGHHLPGGGFVGGLLAGAAYALYSLAFDVASARKKLRAEPVSLAVAGLAITCLSGFPAVLYGKPFLTGIWWEIPLLFGAVFDLGTPLIFDIGIYFVVWGILLTLVFSLGEEA